MTAVPTRLSSREGLKTEDVFDTRKVVKTLESLMTRVTDQNISPESVHAACNCADKIVDILRLHLDVERLKRKTDQK
jgi:hypothetical protein